MSLEIAYAEGQLAALTRYKFSWAAPTDPTVAGSAVLRAKASPQMSPMAKQTMEPPATPASVAQTFSVNEQAETRMEPRRKLSGCLCTSCRKAKHYGSCARPIPIPEKAADFNMGMTGGDATMGNNPSTSPHYQSATSSSALARTPDARPADEQAATGFADLFRHQGIRNTADQSVQTSGALSKVSNDASESARRRAILYRMYGIKLSNTPSAAGPTEKRGPTVHPYTERPPGPVPVVGNNDTGTSRMWGSFDNVVDSTCIDGGGPSGGPAA
jgi:hypothetical protein